MRFNRRDFLVSHIVNFEYAWKETTLLTSPLTVLRVSQGRHRQGDSGRCGTDARPVHREHGGKGYET